MNRVQMVDDLELFKRENAKFWTIYDARTEKVFNSYNADDSEIYDGYRSSMFIEGLVSSGAYWGWIVCKWLIDAVKPLVAALEDGLVGIAGQREPVLAVDQLVEAIPYFYLGDRLWRLYREKSRIEVFDPDGNIQAAFRRCRLMAPFKSAATQPAEPHLTQFGGSASQVGDTERRDEEIRAIIRRDFNPNERGSKSVAAEFRSRHHAFKISNNDLIELIDQVRGHPLQRGRLPGVQKSRPK